MHLYSLCQTWLNLKYTLNQQCIRQHTERQYKQCVCQEQREGDRERERESNQRNSENIRDNENQAFQMTGRQGNRRLELGVGRSTRSWELSLRRLVQSLQLCKHDNCWLLHCWLLHCWLLGRVPAYFSVVWVCKLFCTFLSLSRLLWHFGANVYELQFYGDVQEHGCRE